MNLFGIRVHKTIRINHCIHYILYKLLILFRSFYGRRIGKIHAVDIPSDTDEDNDSDDSLKDADYQPDTAEGDLIEEESINEVQAGDRKSVV